MNKSGRERQIPFKNCDLLCCTPETYIILYINNTSGGGGGRNYKAVWLLREEGLRSGERELDDLRGRQWPGSVLKRMSPPERAQRAGHVNKRRQNPQKDGDSWAFWENLHAGVQERRGCCSQLGSSTQIRLWGARGIRTPWTQWILKNCLLHWC